MGCIDMNTWYSRVDKPVAARLRALRPRPVARRRASPRRSEVALLIKETLDLLELESLAEDERLGGHPHPRAGRAAPHLRPRRGSSPRSSPARSRARIPGWRRREWAKAKRRGVLIDSNQNGEGKTIASAYSVRPKAGAPVSTPLRWDEVNESLDPAAFTMDAVLERVAREGDLFEGVLTSKQSLWSRPALAPLAGAPPGCSSSAGLRRRSALTPDDDEPAGEARERALRDHAAGRRATRTSTRPSRRTAPG